MKMTNSQAWSKVVANTQQARGKGAVASPTNSWVRQKAMNLVKMGRIAYIATSGAVAINH